MTACGKWGGEDGRSVESYTYIKQQKEDNMKEEENEDKEL
jgi:hypothetical protein